MQPAGLAHRQRQDGEDLVAVDDLAAPVHREAAVGVTVQGEADVGAVLEDRGLQHLEVGRPAALVDVGAVGLGADRDDLGTGVAQRPRPDGRGGAVRAVEDDLQP